MVANAGRGRPILACGQTTPHVALPTASYGWSSTAGWRRAVFRRNRPRRGDHLPAVTPVARRWACQAMVRLGMPRSPRGAVSHCEEDRCGRRGGVRRERGPAGERPGPARAGRTGPHGPARRRPRPLRAGTGPGAGHGPVDPGPATTRPRRRGVVAGGVRPPARRRALGCDRGAAAPRRRTGVGERTAGRRGRDHPLPRLTPLVAGSYTIRHSPEFSQL